MIGIDIIEINRIQDAIQKYGDKFIKKIFTPYEIAYCQSFQSQAEKFAARFAVKEAVAKVIKTGFPSYFLDMEIRNDASGAPNLILSDRLKALYPYPIEISISHCKEYAVGMAMAVIH